MDGRKNLLVLLAGVAARPRVHNAALDLRARARTVVRQPRQKPLGRVRDALHVRAMVLVLCTRRALCVNVVAALGADAFLIGAHQKVDRHPIEAVIRIRYVGI